MNSIFLSFNEFYFDRLVERALAGEALAEGYDAAKSKITLALSKRLADAVAFKDASSLDGINKATAAVIEALKAGYVGDSTWKKGPTPTLIQVAFDRGLPPDAIRKVGIVDLDAFRSEAPGEIESIVRMLVSSLLKKASKLVKNDAEAVHTFGAALGDSAPSDPIKLVQQAATPIAGALLTAVNRRLSELAKRHSI